MKKLLVLWIFLIVAGICPQAFPQQKDNTDKLKKSAEDFVTTWIKNWENKNWDDVMKALTETATYSDVMVTQPLSQVIQYLLQSGRMPEMKMTIKSVDAQVLGPSNALVNARYLQETSTDANPKMTDQLDIFLLDKDGKSWKIRNYYSFENFQVNFNPAIDPKWQYGKTDLQQRFTIGVNSRTNLIIYILEENQKKGVSAAQVGMNMGERYAKLGNRQLGFNDLISIYTSFLQSISTYVEIAERNENHAKFRFDPSLYLTAHRDIDAAKLVDYWKNYFQTHASFFGAKADLVQDGNYCILSVDAVTEWLPESVQKQINEALASGNTAKAELIKANFLATQGKVEEANAIFTKIMKSQPDNKEAVQGWLIANMERSPMGEKKALGQLEELGKQFPGNTGILFFKFFIEAEYGMNEEALRDAELLIQLQPDSAVNYVGKGQVLYEMGKYVESFLAFDKATSLDPKRFDVWGMKAGALAKLGKYDEAVAACNKGIELVPSDASAVYNRGCIYCLKGDRARALEDLKSAVALNPGLKEHARSDEDFKSLWKDPEFISLTK